MATNTENYNLIKPSETDKFDINHFNHNADLIDSALSKIANAEHTHDGRYYTEGEIDTKLAKKVDITDLETVESALQNNIAGKVSKSGDTMTGNLTINAGSTNKSYIIKRTDIDREVEATYPSTGNSQTMTLCQIVDKNGKAIGYVERAYRPEGTVLSHVLNQYANGQIRNHQMNQFIGKDGSMYVTIPSLSDAMDSSPKIATTEWVNKIDNDVVHKSRNEEIPGVKTFSADPIVLKNTPSVILKDTKYALTDGVSDNYTYGWHQFKGKDGKDIGRFTVRGYTDGKRRIYQELFGKDGTSSAHMSLWIDANGKAYAEAPTPSSPTDSSGKIATTEWVNNADNDVVHKSRNETISGSKSHTTILHIKSTNIADANAPSNDVVGTRIQFVPNNATNGGYSEYISQFVPFHYKTHTSMQIYVRRVIDGTSVTTSLGIRINADGTPYVTAPTPPSNANSNEVTTADWVNSKLAGKNGLTEFTSWAELEALIKSGKRGDSFNVTMDSTGITLIPDATNSSATIHAYGHYFVDEITVSGGEIANAEFFGSGEVQFKVDGTTKTFGTTGFGRKTVTTEPVWGFRVPQNGMLGYAVINKDEVTSCTGYYISI